MGLFLNDTDTLPRTLRGDDKTDDSVGAPLMPKVIRRACRSGCPHFQPCPVHSKRWARPAVSSARRGYGAQHRRLRRLVLEQEPVCQSCGVRPSEIADHMVNWSIPA
jgi:hypothetical protein